MARPLQSLLDEALENWAFAREGVISELKNLPEKALSFKPTAQTRSVAELVRHIIESGLMMAGELTRPDGDFQRQSFPEFIDEYAGRIRWPASKSGLVKLLASTHAQGEHQFRKMGELALLQQIRRFDGVRGTRYAWMQHGIAHEEYHRGQLALYARLLGRVPALTRLIEGG